MTHPRVLSPRVVWHDPGHPPRRPDAAVAFVCRTPRCSSARVRRRARRRLRDCRLRRRCARPCRRRGPGRRVGRAPAMAQGDADARRPVRAGARHRPEPLPRLPADGPLRPRVRARPPTTSPATSPPTAAPARPRPRRERSGALTSRPTRPAGGRGACRSCRGAARGGRPGGRRRSRWPGSTASRARSRSCPPTRPAATSGREGGCSTSAATTCGSPASGEYFLKAGADAPETLLAYADFDGTVATKKEVPLKTWAPHVRDWRPGDPTWKGGRGKGLDRRAELSRGPGRERLLLPHLQRRAATATTCGRSSSATRSSTTTARSSTSGRSSSTTRRRAGLYLHFKTQETENDDQRLSHERTPGTVPEALDGGAVGVERKLYYRELIARFGHELALNWNLGEENTQTPDEQRAMAAAFHELDPYDHLVVIHTYPQRPGPRLRAAPRRRLRPHRRVAAEPLGRGAPARAEVAARVGAGRPAVGGGERRAGRRRPRRAARSRLRGLLAAARRRRAAASTTYTTSAATRCGAR